MALPQIRCVEMSARINDKTRPAGADFQAERIVVPVRAATLQAVAARIKEQVKIAVSQNESARILETLRAAGSSASASF